MAAQDESAHNPPAPGGTTRKMDESIVHAQKAIGRPLRMAWSLLIAAAVGLVAFAAGRSLNGGARPTTGHATGPATVSSAVDDARQLWTCSMHPQVIQPEPGICPICHMELTPLKRGAHGEHAGAISIDPVVVQNMGVRTTAVTRGPIVQTVRAVGYLEEPEPLHHDINLRVNGWIERLYANIDGMAVKQGAPLFDLYSPELTVAVDELIAARKQSARVPGDESTRQLLDSSRRKLIQFGLSAGQIDQLGALDTAPTTVQFLSPIDGHLTSKMVYEGAAVKAGDLVMRLASRHQMWIDAQVPEQQMSLISDGQPIRATLVSQPGKVFTGKVLFVHPHLDPQTRTALVRMQIDNDGLALRQGMYATVEILADSYREAPLLPREAVIDTGRRQVVFVSSGEGRFELRDVSLGMPGQDGTVEVLSGVAAGETIVTSGQFLLDSESRLKDAVAKHLNAGLPGHAGHAGTPAQSTSPSAVQTVEKITVPHADQIVLEYIDLVKKLGARQEADKSVDAKPLADAAAMAAEHGTGDGKAMAEKIAAAAKALDGKSLADQRAAFVGLSDAVIELSRRGKLSPAVAPTLYVMHCPMAFQDKGANWLQDEEAVANPYYATQMKRCGEVVERITPTK